MFPLRNLQRLGAIKEVGLLDRLSCNIQRWYSSVTEGEKRIENILRKNLHVHEIDVRDISGGCGSMYDIYVSSVDFKKKRILQQHKLVNEILKEEVATMHGLKIRTEIPDEA